MPFCGPISGYFSTAEGIGRGSIAACTPVCRCRGRNSADRRGCFGVPSAALAAKHQAKAPHKAKPEAPAPVATCQDEAGLACSSSPMAPVEGRALARDLHRGEAARRRAFADRAERKHVAAASGDRHGGPPYFWFAEVASPAAGTWQAMLVRDGAPAECSTVTREIVVQRRQPPRPRAGQEASGPCAMPGIATRKICIRRGSRSCSTRRSTRSRRGRRCMRCCATARAMSSSTHLGLREDEKGQIIQPDCADASVFLARLFRLQDGAAVRLFEMHARRRRPGAEMPAVVEHRERGASLPRRPSGLTPRPGEQVGFFGVFAAPVPAPAARGFRRRPQGLVPGFGYYLRTTIANGVHSGIRANGG